MVFTEKGELQHASRSSREKFLKDWGWTPFEDFCTEVYVPSDNPYVWPKDLKPQAGELPEYYAEQAIAYIRTITRQYPFQMRQFLGEPLWLRFCHRWAATGDYRKSMRAI